MSDNLPQRGLLKELFGALPPLARTILMWFLMFPIAIAVSGMLLQVNVGALIQDSLKQSRGETVDIVNRMLTQKVDQLDEKIEKFQDGLNAQIFTAKDLDKRLTLVEREVESLKQRQQ